jgi:hypothetical protein
MMGYSIEVLVTDVDTTIVHDRQKNSFESGWLTICIGFISSHIARIDSTMSSTSKG